MSHKYIANVLRIMVVVMALLGVGLYCYVVPLIAVATYDKLFDFGPYIIYVEILAYLLTGVPCYYVLYRVLRVAKNFEKDEIFVRDNVTHFKHIYTATMIDVIYFALLSVVLFVLGINRELFFIILKLLICFIGLAFGFVVRVIGEMVSKATDLQEENDLTI